MLKPLLLALLLSGCATADYAQLADVGSTAAAFHYGFIESNPVISGLPIAGIAAAKVVLNTGIKLTPKEVCEPGLFMSTLAGTGAALWNIALICGSAPAAIPIIAALWFVYWDEWQEAAVRDCEESHQFMAQTFYEGSQ